MGDKLQSLVDPIKLQTYVQRNAAKLKLDCIDEDFDTVCEIFSEVINKSMMQKLGISPQVNEIPLPSGEMNHELYIKEPSEYVNILKGDIEGILKDQDCLFENHYTAINGFK